MKCKLYLVIQTAYLVLAQCAEQTSPFHLSNTDEVSDTDSETQTIDTESWPHADDTNEENSSEDCSTDSFENDSNADSDSYSDMESDSGTDSDFYGDSDLDTDTDTNSEDYSDSDDVSNCPGSCQYNEVSSTTLIASGIAGGFYVDPSIEFYLMCTDQKGSFITHTENNIPIYDGWILDTSYECAEGLYCCRPQRSADKYCNDTGGTCIPSDTIETGSGFCAFPSNTCKEKD